MVDLFSPGELSLGHTDEYITPVNEGMIEELQLDVPPTHHVYAEAEPAEDTKILAVARVTRDGDPPELAAERLEEAVRFSTGNATGRARLGPGPASITGELENGASFDLPS